MPKYVLSAPIKFTSWLPNCELNRTIQKQNNLTNSHDYRYFLQHNAEKIMGDLQKQCDSDCTSCPICKASTEWKPLDYNGKQ